MKFIQFLQTISNWTQNYAFRILLIVLVIALLGAQTVTNQASALSRYAPTVTNVSYSPNELPPVITTGVKANNMANTTGGSGYCEYGACYYWATMADYGITAAGASVSITQAQPKVGPNDLHSLAELAVESYNGQQVVEIGWLVAPGINQDSLTHLFVYHWVNGAETCYNGCGFVPTTTTYTAGGLVKVNTVGTYSIHYGNSKWIIRYDGVELGYFPESIWGGTFTKTSLVQTFGEVASSSATTPLTQMGNGLFGTKTNSARISNFNLIGTKNTRLLDYSADQAPAVYTIGHYNSSCKLSCGMNFGGPGY
jgi:hypothetical protein